MVSRAMALLPRGAISPTHHITSVAARPGSSHCHLGLGKLSRRTGDGANAEEHLTIAATMYREMDMGSWLARAETELRRGA